MVGASPNAQVAQVTARAFVRAFKPDELTGGISQTDSQVIISPSEITDAGWPGGQPEKLQPLNPDPRIPLASKDKIVIQGRERAISFVKPFLLAGS